MNTRYLKNAVKVRNDIRDNYNRAITAGLLDDKLERDFLIIDRSLEKDIKKEVKRLLKECK